MKTSERGIALIKRHEGLRLGKYLCPAGRPTIGYGHLILPSENLQTITESEAHTLLTRDLNIAEDAITKLIIRPLTQNEFDALVSLVFNIGANAFRSSTLLKYINDKNYCSPTYPTIKDAWLSWCHISGIKNEALLSRRQSEWSLYIFPPLAQKSPS
ncbi:MAG: lysozyme [Rickettsiales bacterium]|jgi:lysozyme|nr:lysozyme [Rickettsiales bacterium]